MKFIVFLMLVVALTALNLASHNWEKPDGECDVFLQNKVDNENGKLVIKPGGHNYHRSCTDIYIDNCILYA